MRVIAGRAFESTSVMIGLVRLDPSKPHWQAALRALWLLKNQSRWIKRMGLRHGHTCTRWFSQGYFVPIQSRAAASAIWVSGAAGAKFIFWRWAAKQTVKVATASVTQTEREQRTTKIRPFHQTL